MIGPNAARIKTGKSRKRNRSTLSVAGTVCLVLVFGAPVGRSLSPGLSVSSSRASSREFLDPCLGSRWQLLTNPSHPEWPGRLVLLEASRVRASDGRSTASADERTRKPIELAASNGWSNRPSDRTSNPSPNRWPGETQIDPPSPAPALPPVIHAGETVLVHQDTEVLQSRLLAVALQSAAPGQQMLVRLRIDSDAGQRSRGPVVKVVANGKGEATWAKQERNRL
jgi:hypothetical protein